MILALLFAIVFAVGVFVGVAGMLALRWWDELRIGL